MKRKIIFGGTLIGALLTLALSAGADIIQYDRGTDYSRYISVDRYLEVEIWTDDDQYYEGDNIDISFRANQDCFVAVYNIDTRGMVNLIYPAGPGESGRIQGDRTYRLPDRNDDYQLTVRGPEGTEYLQIVASRHPLQIPDWWNGSDLICDDDPFDFAQYVIASYFDCGDDCPRATDMTSFEVRDWHPRYFRPVHIYDYPDWSVCGSIYVDYPFGATIYIDGIYWGVAPLFIPRIFWGYHYITVIDRFGYCWEDRVHVVRYKSVVLNDNIIRTRAGVKSRYRDVVRRGFLDPAKNGYPDFEKQVRVKESYRSISKGGYDVTTGKKTRISREGVWDDGSRQSSGKKRSDSFGTQPSTRKGSSPGDESRVGKKTQDRARDVDRSGKSGSSSGRNSGIERSKKSSGGESRAVDAPKKESSQPAVKEKKSSSGSGGTSKRRR